MTIGSIGLVQAPSFEGDDLGGSPSGGGTPNPSGGTPSAAIEPSAIDVDDNVLIRVKGSDKPVKFGEHVRGFQSQFTRASQEAARLKGELAKRDQRLQQFERERQAAQSRQQGNQGNELVDQLKTLPYLSGEQAHQVIQGIGEQFKQRDMVLLAALNQVKQMKSVLDGLHGNHINSSFEGKISKWIDEGGYPKELTNWAKELYLAYEGDDLDQEFPRILKERYEEVNKALNAQREAKVRAARQTFVPGKGGNGSPSKPLEFKGNESAKDIADRLWSQFGSDSET